MTEKFTLQEISVLDQLLSTIDLKALLNSAEIGFKVKISSENSSRNLPVFAKNPHPPNGNNW